MAVDNKTQDRSGTADPAGETAGSRRLKYGLSVGILLLSLLIILGVINWLASDTAYRMDLTERGRYSISQQTRNLLKSLNENVTITLLFAESDPTLNSDQQRLVTSQRREVEDVLRELRNKSDKIEVVQIDPTDPRTITKYDALIDQLKAIYKDESDTYEAAAQAGRTTLDELSKFAGQESEALISAVGDLPPDHALFRDFQTIIQILAIIPREIETVDKSIEEDLNASPMTGSPFADVQGAVSIVRAAAQLRSGTLNQIADFFQQAIDGGTLPETLATKLKPSIQRNRDMASSLLDQKEKIDDLNPLELTSISAALRSRNCVLLTSATRATVLPYNRLFPPPSAQQAMDEEGSGSLQRFAGETVLASGIRQLTLVDRPHVILCHAEQTPSILTGRRGTVDLSSVANQLKDLGFDVQEWNVNSGPRPVVTQQMGQPVWVIVPPEPTGQQMMAGGELADAAKQLVAEGANVMIGFFPSLVPGLGQKDQWNTVIEPLGVSADTGRFVVKKVPGPNGQDGFYPNLDFVDFLSDNPIATAVRGEPTQLTYVVPLNIVENSAGTSNGEPDEKPANPADPNLHRTVLLEIKPTERVWATNIENVQTGELKPSNPPDVNPYAVLIAIERNGNFGLQRALLAGSASWYWTGQAGQYDFSTQLPMYPGNSELFTAGVCWLAHLDDLIARSPRAESVARIENLSNGAQIFWRWALIGGLPVLSLVAGIFVAISRRG